MRTRPYNLEMELRSSSVVTNPLDTNYLDVFLPRLRAEPSIFALRPEEPLGSRNLVFAA